MKQRNARGGNRATFTFKVHFYSGLGRWALGILRILSFANLKG